MNKNLKKELLHAFSGATVLFDASQKEKLQPLFVGTGKNGETVRFPEKINPELVLYDKKNLYCVVQYKQKNFATLRREFEALKQFYPGWRELDFNSLCHGLQNTQGKPIANCLTNVCFDVYAKFNKFHLSNNNTLEEPRLYHCSILCSNRFAGTIQKTLEILCAENKLDFGETKIIILKNHALFSVNIVSFYWITRVHKLLKLLLEKD